MVEEFKVNTHRSSNKKCRNKSETNQVKQSMEPEQYVFLKLPLGNSNQHLIEKIAVISEKSDSSFDSDSSIELSEED